jgi:hypothetical protein
MKRPEVPKGEHVIARGTEQLAGAEYALAATNVALRRHNSSVRWDLIESAVWEEPQLHLVVRTDPGAGPERISMTLTDSRSLVETVRDRVTASVLTSQRRALPSGAVATFAARRRSDDGTIVWSVVFDGNPDLTDPVLRAEADAVLADLRGSLGI